MGELKDFFLMSSKIKIIQYRKHFNMSNILAFYLGSAWKALIVVLFCNLKKNKIYKQLRNNDQLNCKSMIWYYRQLPGKAMELFVLSICFDGLKKFMDKRRFKRNNALEFSNTALISRNVFQKRRFCIDFFLLTFFSYS